MHQALNSLVPRYLHDIRCAPVIVAAADAFPIFGTGLAIRPNADSFVLKRQDLYLARAGGGVLMALRGRILVRLEVTNMTLFDSESTKNAQTYSGGFGVYF